MDALVDALNAGDKLGKVDAAFFGLGGVPDHAIEYDDGFWHDTDRIGGDEKKSKKMLAMRSGTMIVCRVRLEAPPLALTDPRLVVAHVPDRHPGRAVAAMAKALAAHPSVSHPLRKRLLAAKGTNDKHAIDLAHTFFLKADKQYKADLDAIATEVGPDNARRILATHGVKTRVGDVLAGIRFLSTELKLNTDQVVSLAGNDCAAGRVESVDFRAALGYLQRELSLSTAELVSLAGNDCAARRVESVDFRAALGYLQRELGLSTTELVSLAGNECAASRVESVDFRAALGCLQRELGLSTTELVSLAGNNCAARRVESADFRAALGCLQRELGLSTTELVSLAGNDCAARRVESVDFRVALGVLCRVIGTDGLVTVLRKNGQLASRFTPAMAASLARVAVQAKGYGLDGGDTLRTIVSQSVPMIKKIESLATHVESLTTKAAFVAFVKSCKGDAHSKRNLVASALPLTC